MTLFCLIALRYGCFGVFIARIEAEDAGQDVPTPGSRCVSPVSSMGMREVIYWNDTWYGPAVDTADTFTSGGIGLYERYQQDARFRFARIQHML